MNPTIAQAMEAWKHGALMFGNEDIEVEFRTKATKSQFDKVTETLTKTLGEPTTRVTKEDIVGPDCRRVVVDHEEPTYVYKKRLYVGDLERVRLSVCLERRGDPPQQQQQGIWRHKTRTSYQQGPWRWDLTRVKTNDPRYKDEDEDLYEIELELDMTRPELLYYTMDRLLDDGLEVFQQQLKM